jgi:hypothetical protein
MIEPLKIRFAENDMIISGNFISSIDNNEFKYIAPSPPDFRSSFSGSALPYSSEEQAFYNTINKGHVTLVADNKFIFKITTPNSYVDGFSENVIEPYIIFFYSKDNEVKKLKINLNNYIPFRSITHPIDRNAEFYNNINHLPIRTQEQILIDSQYPKNNNIKDFWGLKPAC